MARSCGGTPDARWACCRWEYRLRWLVLPLRRCGMDYRLSRVIQAVLVEEVRMGRTRRCDSQRQTEVGLQW